MNINNNTRPTPANINFGITLRKTNINLGVNDVKNSSCFFRSSESTPLEIASTYLDNLGNAKFVEQTIWGASDLSNFCATTLAQIKLLGLDAYKRIFRHTDLMDIDETIASRAAKHVIGVTDTEFNLLEESLKINHQDYFTKVADGKKYFLDGEDYFIYESLTKKNEAVDFYHISDDIMHGTTINSDASMIDIRKGVKNLKPHSEDTVRICEFANGWYFMPWPEQVEIVKNFAKNLQSGDMIRIGMCELDRSLDIEFLRRGFRRINSNIPELLIKE